MNAHASSHVRREMEGLMVEARTLLDRLPRSARTDLTSVAGWHSLMEWCCGESADAYAADVAMLKRLAVRWFRLFRQLRFESGTRPVSNS